VLLLAVLATAASCAVLGAATYAALGVVVAVATPYCICEMLKKISAVRSLFNRMQWQFCCK
jgi:hypothetical protein